MRTFIFCVLLGFSWSLPNSEDELSEQWVKELFQNSTGEIRAPEKELNLDPVAPEKEISCLTDKNETGVCVIYYLCDPDSGSIITDGTTLLDIRELRCPHYLEVCCLESRRISSQEEPPPARPSTTPKSTVADRLTTVTQVVPTPTLRPQAAASCGWSSALTSIFKPGANSDDRVLADFGEFPWMVAVLVKRPGSSVWNTDDFLGGGALIHPSIVLTVAHAVNNENQTLKCRAGEWDVQTTREQFPFQERDVTEKLIHPKYSRESLKYDFALLVLVSAFEQAPHIGVACVARALPLPGALCFGMGWGKHANNDTYAVVLKKVRQQLVDAEECAQVLRTAYGPFFRIHRSLTCARGPGGQDTCRGDGGSPLVCPVDKSSTGQRRYVVAGLVAYGVQCGLKDDQQLAVPAVHAKVSQARAWIDTVVGQRGLPALEIV